MICTPYALSSSRLFWCRDLYKHRAAGSLGRQAKKDGPAPPCGARSGAEAGCRVSQPPAEIVTSGAPFLPPVSVRVITNIKNEKSFFDR